MHDREKVIKALQSCSVQNDVGCQQCPYFESRKAYGHEWCTTEMAQDALELLKEKETRIKKYEYVFDFLGIGFREWATKILDGEAEVICEADEHEHKTVITFKLI